MHKNLKSLMFFSFIFCIHQNILSEGPDDGFMTEINENKIAAQQQNFNKQFQERRNKVIQNFTQQQQKNAEHKAWVKQYNEQLRQEKCTLLTHELINILAFERWAKENDVDTIHVTWERNQFFILDKIFYGRKFFDANELKISIKDIELNIADEDTLSKSIICKMQRIIEQKFYKKTLVEQYTQVKLSDVIENMVYELRSELEQNKCSIQD